VVRARCHLEDLGRRCPRSLRVNSKWSCLSIAWEVEPRLGPFEIVRNEIKGSGLVDMWRVGGNVKSLGLNPLRDMVYIHI